jgi:transposase
MSSAQRGPVITKEILARRWGIGLDTAHRTLTATTQVGIRRVLHPVERCYKTRQSHLRYPTLNTRFYTDTMYASTKSLKGNTCAQVFTNGTGYDLFYPLKKESLASEALTEVIRSIGIPKELVSDGAKAETQGDFGNIVREYKIKPTTTEPYSEWQNRAEAAVREIKRGLKRTMQRTRTPKRLWDYCGEWVAAVRRLTAHDLPGLDGRVPDEVVKGNMPDIAEYAQFNPAVQFPNDQRQLARWIGVAHSIGNPMTFWVLPSTCKVLARSTVWSLTEDERQNPAIQAQMAKLDASIHEKVGDLVPDDEVDGELLGINPKIPDDIFLEEHDDEFEPPEPGAADDFTPEAYDEYLTAEVLLLNMGEVTRAKVIGRKCDADGNPIGLQNTNPILDTREYKVEFPDGATNVFMANMITESM